MEQVGARDFAGVQGGDTRMCQWFILAGLEGVGAEGTDMIFVSSDSPMTSGYLLGSP